MLDGASWWKSLLLGVVQGLTEFLPISSSGHLIAAKEVLSGDVAQLSLSFDVALHVATLAAVIVYFRKTLLSLVRDAARWRLLGILALATVPGVALGLLLGSWRDSIDPVWVVGGWLFSATYLLFSRDRGGDRDVDQVRSWQGFLVGCAQALAIFPGVSRSGSSIVCGLWLGLEKDAACRFSFLLAIPLILGAGLKKTYDLFRNDALGSFLSGSLVIGMLAAFLVGLGAIHLLLGIVRRGSLHRFGWYNLAAAVAFALFLYWRRGA